MPHDRQFYTPEVGTELKSDNTIFDVQAWRDDVITEINETQTKLDTIDATIITEGNETQELLTDILDGKSESTATLTQVVVNASTSVIVKTASTDFIYFAVSNENDDIVWLKFQSAATDNDKKGILMEKGDFYEMPKDKYTGEISAISSTVNTTLSITTY